MVINEDGGKITISKEKPTDWRLKKAWENPNYPYKRYVLCPH